MRATGLALRSTLQDRMVTVPIIATVGLLAFYYLARADVVATRQAAGAWTVVTGGPLPPLAHYVAAGLLLGVLPVGVTRVLHGVSLRDLGLGAGRWRAGLVWLAAGLPLGILAAQIAAGDPAMRAVYPLAAGLEARPASFVQMAALQFLYYGAWEVLFRGVVLLGLEERLGGGAANALQTALTVLAHFGRPLTETFAALPAGLLFGAITLRLRSVWYVALIHWTVGIATDWYILAHATS